MQIVFPFLAVAALVIVVPGQDTALTIRNTLLGGRRSGILTAAGVSMPLEGSDSTFSRCVMVSTPSPK